MKTIWILTVLAILIVSQSFSNVQQKIIQASENERLEVNVRLHVNKIYNLNSVDETYQIDGYILYSWHDKNVDEWYKKHIWLNPNDSLSNSIIYENERADELIKNEINIPAFELMNVHEGRETTNKRIELFADGSIEYEERFFATFNSVMNFRSFPFDTQKYLIEIEAFSYDTTKLIFTEANLFPKPLGDNRLGEDWKIINQNDTITPDPYPYLQDSAHKESYYSKVTFTIEAQRLPGYYVWQVLFPLIIIILASFTIFWIDEFSTQIGVGFTLMLTVVAFNFYSASILPKLPYNTFIEYVIIVGYIFIFLSILSVIIVNSLGKKKDKIRLLKYFRYVFPLAYAVIMTTLYLKSIAF